jgi:hypothetical protein
MNSDISGQPGDFFLNPQRSQTGTNGVILQRHRRTEHRHDAVAGELVDRKPCAFWRMPHAGTAAPFVGRRVLRMFVSNGLLSMSDTA